jgi:hypothetical protein
MENSIRIDKCYVKIGNRFEKSILKESLLEMQPFKKRIFLGKLGIMIVYRSRIVARIAGKVLGWAKPSL